MARQYSIVIETNDDNLTAESIREQIAVALGARATLLSVERTPTLEKLEDEMRLDLDDLLDDFESIQTLA